MVAFPELHPFILDLDTVGKKKKKRKEEEEEEVYLQESKIPGRSGTD